MNRILLEMNKIRLGATWRTTAMTENELEIIVAAAFMNSIPWKGHTEWEHQKAWAYSTARTFIKETRQLQFEDRHPTPKKEEKLP